MDLKPILLISVSEQLHGTKKDRDLNYSVCVCVCVCSDLYHLRLILQMPSAPAIPGKNLVTSSAIAARMASRNSRKDSTAPKTDSTPPFHSPSSAPSRRYDGVHESQSLSSPPSPSI